MTRAAMQLEFAPRATRAPPASLGLLLLGVISLAVAAIWLARILVDNNFQARALAEAGGRHPLAAPAVTLRPTSAELLRVQFVRQTSHSLQTPWADLLAVLETAPKNVALLSVEPSATKRTVALTAETAAPPDMLDYLRVLQSDSRLSSVILVSHQVQNQTAGAPIRFQIQANWEGSP